MPSKLQPRVAAVRTSAEVSDAGELSQLPTAADELLGKLAGRARMRILSHEWPFPVSIEGGQVWRNLLDVPARSEGVTAARAARPSVRRAGSSTIVPTATQTRGRAQAYA